MRGLGTNSEKCGDDTGGGDRFSRTSDLRGISPHFDDGHIITTGPTNPTSPHLLHDRVVYTERMSEHAPAPGESGSPDGAGSTPVDLPSDIIASGRLESFSDGVMAVIITFMAFNLRPPAGEHWTQVTQRLPTLLIYILSFTVIGIYWSNHHHLLRLARTISGGVMWTNLSLLFCLSLVPVVTQWVGQASNSAFPAVAYGIVSLASALTYFALVRAILRANHHDEQLLSALGRDVKGMISPFISLAGIAVAPLSPYLSYACYALLSLMWIVPDRRLVREHRH